MVFASACPGKLNPWSMLTVSRHCSFTDWLFLVYLAKNLDGMVFREMFVGLAEELEEKKPTASKGSLINFEEGSHDY